ncbi:unnamed protein product [Miscanthus lutarioriparius]|uniref:Uncharacterized protein n=1 Tax=Miscanthus lutarioriparius TaxID=422564 RepID=A0A811MY54_9POAL|nr:unnamed protein product [Miscanthus lutarioriparius]
MAAARVGQRCPAWMRGASRRSTKSAPWRSHAGTYSSRCLARLPSDSIAAWTGWPPHDGMLEAALAIRPGARGGVGRRPGLADSSHTLQDWRLSIYKADYLPQPLISIDGFFFVMGQAQSLFRSRLSNSLIPM